MSSKHDILFNVVIVAIYIFMVIWSAVKVWGMVMEIPEDIKQDLYDTTFESSQRMGTEVLIDYMMHECPDCEMDSHICPIREALINIIMSRV